MTHRDRVGDPPGRREAAGDVGHRQGLPTPSGGSPTRPERRLPKAFGRRRARLAMSRLAPRSEPQTVGSRLDGGLSALLGISPWRAVRKICISCRKCMRLPVGAARVSLTF